MWNFGFAVYGSSFSHVFFHWAEQKAVRRLVHGSFVYVFPMKWELF